MQRNPKRRRVYRYKKQIDKRLLLAVAVVLALVLIIFGAVKLTDYVLDMLSSRKTTKELRQIYDEAPTDVPVLVTPEPVEMSLAVQEQKTPAPVETPAISAEPIQTPAPMLASAAYPNNPKLKVSSRFKSLQKECKHIIGWVNIDRLLDEPVVQWNNVYYLNHDIKGKENSNGTVFLDSIIQLKNRPFTYILYGHNMKSGEMFGCLRNYENAGFYHANPFITFDTMYESNRYVIFAVGEISTEEGHGYYVDFLGLTSKNIQERKAAIDMIIDASNHTCMIDVKPEDQLLLLVTCVGNDANRRIVAARCIRSGENENDLKRLVEQSSLK